MTDATTRDRCPTCYRYRGEGAGYLHVQGEVRRCLDMWHDSPAPGDEMAGDRKVTQNVGGASRMAVQREPGTRAPETGPEPPAKTTGPSYEPLHESTRQPVAQSKEVMPTERSSRMPAVRVDAEAGPVAPGHAMSEPLISDEEIEAQYNVLPPFSMIPFARRVEALVRKRLGERLNEHRRGLGLNDGDCCDRSVDCVLEDVESIVAGEEK